MANEFKVPAPAISLEGVELQEFCFSETSAQFAVRKMEERGNVIDTDSIRAHIRGALRLHRFTVMNWLMMNGVKIPIELLADQNHPEVGQMRLDT